MRSEGRRGQSGLRGGAVRSERRRGQLGLRGGEGSEVEVREERAVRSERRRGQ